jgi:hypothetical protein
MKIAVITNSRIPSLTANSIQAMKVCQALVQIGHEVRVFAPRETKPASREELAKHYGLRIVPSLDGSLSNNSNASLYLPRPTPPRIRSTRDTWLRNLPWSLWRGFPRSLKCADVGDAWVHGGPSVLEGAPKRMTVTTGVEKGRTVGRFRL